MAESSVSEWLASIDCQRYAQQFERSGYRSVSSLSSLNEDQLTEVGVFDANHRSAILNKATGGFSDDFDSMLGDLSSVIKDLESFTVPTQADPGKLPTNTSVPSTRPKPPKRTTPELAKKKQAPLQDPDDFDLDSLLNDLTSFNPDEVVASTHPPPPPLATVAVQQAQAPPTPPPQQQHKFPTPQPSPAHQQRSPAHQQRSPAHQRPPGQVTPNHTSSGSSMSGPTPTPPSTPGHTPQRSYTVADPEGVVVRRRPSEQDSEERKPVNLRSGSVSGATSGDRDIPQIITIHVPNLSAATDTLTTEEVQKRLQEKAEELRLDTSLTDEEREAKLKEEKMRIGIEKMKMAHKKRVAIKVFNPDRSNKTVVVEEGMTTSMVCHLLVVKNHFDESPNWVLVEQLGDVSLERELEDHENIVDVYSTWPRDHNNVFLFKQNEKKYDLFEDPIKYFPNHLRQSQAANVSQSTLERTEKARKILLQEYFSSTSRVPELEGFLHLKDGYKKSWKKVYMILRASGLYYSTKGKQKSAKYLHLLVQFDEVELYHGINFKKTLKAPSQFCFSLRPLSKTFVPGPKDIKVLCADDEPTALSWTAGIRLAKYGLQLRDNFHKAKMTQFKLEDLTVGDGTRHTAGDRASKLIGMRLEKHMDKLREHYQQQKMEETDRRQRYHSPQLSWRDKEDGAGGRGGDVGDGGDGPAGSSDQLSSNTSDSPFPTPEHTPSPSPVAPPKTAPKPQKRSSQTPPRQVNGGVAESQTGHVTTTPQQQQGYNPYPAPSQPAPVPAPRTEAPPTQPRPPQQQQQQVPPQPAPRQQQQEQQQTVPVVQPRAQEPLPPSPQEQGPSPTDQQRGSTASPDKEALFAFAWYHGSIGRDDATRRLEAMGCFDGLYLVRDSTTVPNSFVLTMYAKSVAKNFQIMPVEHPSGMRMYRIDDGPAYSSIDQLLRHYKLDSDRLPCRLTEFAPRPPTRMTEC